VNRSAPETLVKDTQKSCQRLRLLKPKVYHKLGAVNLSVNDSPRTPSIYTFLRFKKPLS